MEVLIRDYCASSGLHDRSPAPAKVKAFRRNSSEFLDLRIAPRPRLREHLLTVETPQPKLC